MGSVDLDTILTAGTIATILIRAAIEIVSTLR